MDMVRLGLSGCLLCLGNSCCGVHINKGADAYVVKPFDAEKMLEILKEQLEKQAQERKVNEERVAEFTQTRVKELSTQEAKTV